MPKVEQQPPVNIPGLIPVWEEFPNDIKIGDMFIFEPLTEHVTTYLLTKISKNNVEYVRFSSEKTSKHNYKEPIKNGFRAKNCYLIKGNVK